MYILTAEEHHYPGQCSLANTMVPTILVYTEKAMVALYCVKHDLLLVSYIFYWRDDKFNMPGITILWAMINHKYEIVKFKPVYIEYIQWILPEIHNKQG